MIIDAHVHIASWPSLKRCRENILYSMKKYGISYCLISNCDCSEFPSLDDRYPVRQVSQTQGLKECIDFAKKHPNEIGVLVWINPNKEKLDNSLKEMINKNIKYIHGFKFHPWESQMKITDKRLIPYLEYISSMNMPLLVHTAADKYSSIKEIGKIAKKYPNIKFVAAHLELCTDDKSYALKIMKENPNIYCDTAWVKMKDAKAVIKQIGIDRICFGTDNPIDGKETLSNELYKDYFENTPILNNEQKEHLLYLNALNIYNIKQTK